MRISNVNNFSNYNFKSRPMHSNNQNFNGLWGKTSISGDIDEVCYIPVIYETKYYYPFRDEKQQDVDRIIEESKTSEITENGCFASCLLVDCRPGMRLPFSRQEYEAYMKLTKRPHDHAVEVIHQAAKTKYINDAFGSLQVPAYNQIIDKQRIPRLY